MRVGIVGAGLAGLAAGQALSDAGHEVVLFERGSGPGGRMATRRIDDATLDHGAQFFTVRAEAFARMVAGWEGDGLVQEWCRGFASGDGAVHADGHPRYVVAGGMNALAKHLARGLDVRTRSLVFALRRGERTRWSIRLDDGHAEEVDAAVVTCPLPQAFSLLVTADSELPAALRGTDYDRTLALLAVLDRPGAVPAPGGVQHADETFSFIGDNQAKGLSGVPAITAHANPDWSLAWWDREPEVALAELRRLAKPWLGRATIVTAQLKRWRFATPQAIWPDACWLSPDAGPPVVLAGDAFAGPRVEGAVLSGMAAADALVA